MTGHGSGLITRSVRPESSAPNDCLRHSSMPTRFIPPTFLQRVASLPEGPEWGYEVKLDGYRALAIKTNGKVLLRFTNNKDFNSNYPSVAKALAVLPDETVIDCEVVALDSTGRPSFNLLQNVGSSKAKIAFQLFDLLVLAGRDPAAQPFRRTPSGQGPKKVQREHA